RGTALGKPERLVLKGVDDVGDGDILRRALERVAAVQGANADHKTVAGETLENLAHRRHPETQRNRKIACAVHPLWRAGHLAHDERAVVGEFADAKHVVSWYA